MAMSYMERCGQRVADRRRAQDKTQIWLAAAVGVDQKTISRIEAGTVSPRDETRRAIADALDCDPDELWAWSEAVA